MLSTARARVADHLFQLLGGASSINNLACAEFDKVTPGADSEPPPTVLLLDCATFAPQQRNRLQQTARGHFPARVLWLLDVPPPSDYAVRLVLDAVKTGWCHGYITGDWPLNSLVRAITAVARRDIWLPRAMLVRALTESRCVRSEMEPSGVSVHESGRTRILLTMREGEILHLVRRGLTNKAIGQHLEIKEDTVKKHLRNMFAKFGVHRRAQMLLRSIGNAREYR